MPGRLTNIASTVAAWLFGLLWALPLLYAIWAAFHPSAFATNFDPLAPLTLRNFERAWTAAPFARYFLNTILLVLGIMITQFVICTLAAFGFARRKFFGSEWLFALILVQLMVTPDVLILENYRTLQSFGLIDTLTGVGLPYVASAFGIFLLRQTFKSIPKELDDAARMEGASTLQTIWRVYLPLARPVYVAYGLVSVSYHWNNFLWPLIVTNSVETRPLTVGLQVFASVDQGIDWSVISAAALMTSAPLMCAPEFTEWFRLFQRRLLHPLPASAGACRDKQTRAAINSRPSRFRSAAHAAIAGPADFRRCRGRSARSATPRHRARSKTDCRRRRDSGHARARMPRARRPRGSRRFGPSTHIVECTWSCPCSTSSDAMLLQQREQRLRIRQPLDTRVRTQRVVDQQHAKQPARPIAAPAWARALPVALRRAFPSPSAAASELPWTGRSAPAGRGGAGRGI